MKNLSLEFARQAVKVDPYNLLIPKSLIETFIQFLDLAQSEYTDKDMDNMTKDEAQTIKFVRELVREYTHAEPSTKNNKYGVRGRTSKTPPPGVRGYLARGF